MGFDNVNVNVSGPVQPTSTYKTKVLKGNHSFASQVTEPNMKYVIKHDFVLEGNVTIPENCVLEFDGGSLRNGSLVLQNTKFDGVVRFSADVEFSGTCANQTAYQSWFENNDIDAWHKFINGVECNRYEYSSGTYNSTIPISKAVDNIEIAGNGATINYTFVKNYFHAVSITPKNLLGAKSYLSADALKGSKSISVIDASEFNVGDIVAIKDNSVSSFSTERNYQQGEFVEIIGKEGNIIYLAAPLFGNYILKDKNGDAKIDDQGNSLLTVNVVYFANVSIHNINLASINDDGTKFTCGLELTQVTGSIANVSSVQWTYKINITRSKDVIVLNCGVSTFNKKIAGVEDYGLSLLSSQKISVINGTYIAGNHGITISTNYTGETNIIPRRVTLQNIIASTTDVSGLGIDAHVGEYILVQGCIGDGLNIFANCFTIKDCNVTGDIICVTHNNLNSTIDNCVATSIKIITREHVGSYEYSSINWTPLTTPEVLNINGNRCETLNIYFANGVTSYYPNINNVTYNLSQNSFKSCALGLDAKEMDYANNGMTINMTDNISIANNESVMLVAYCKELNVSNHTIKNTDSYSAFILRAKRAVFNGCSIYNGYIANNDKIDCLEILDTYFEMASNTFICTLGNIENMSIRSCKIVGTNYGVRIAGNIDNLAMIDCDATAYLTVMQDYVPSVASTMLFRGNRALNAIYNNTSQASDNYLTIKFENNTLLRYSTSPNNIAKVTSDGDHNYYNAENLPDYSNIQSVYVNLVTNAIANQNYNGSYLTPQGEMRMNYIPEQYADVYYDIYVRNTAYSAIIVNLRAQRLENVKTLVDVTLMFNIYNGTINNFKFLSPNGYQEGVCEIYYYLDVTNNIIKLYVKRIPTNTRIPCLLSWYSLRSYDNDNKNSVDKVALGSVSTWDSSSAILIPTSILHEGNTALRPVGSGIYIGFQYFDTSITPARPIYAKAISGDTVTWVDATGTPV